MSNINRRTRRILPPMVGVIALATIAACSTDNNETSSDTSQASASSVAPAALTCEGAGTDDAAQISYRAETLINAPLSTIWDLQTNVDGWPTWQQPVESMTRLDQGPLARDSRFRWTTPVPETPTTPATTLSITSTVQDIAPESCIRWSGPALGDGLSIDNGVHVWNFNKVDGGVLVSTEESWTGAQVEADVPTATAALGAGLDAWLNDLKTTAEGRQ